MPTGTPLTETERLVRSITSDMVKLAKLAEKGEVAQRKLDAARQFLAGSGSSPSMTDELAKARTASKRRATQTRQEERVQAS